MAEASSLSGPAELTHEDCPWGDTYVGSAEALIAAGLVTADQLPGLPGRNKFTCTFYDGRPVKKGATNHLRNERYLKVARRGSKFEVFRGLSKKVEDERRAAMRAERELEAAVKYEEQKREAASKKTPEDFRQNCLFWTQVLQDMLRGGGELSGPNPYPFMFSADARDEMASLLSELEALIRSSEVMRLHSEKASARKGRLQLVWSAA